MTVCALAIGGLDPGGGAGIAADLRAFHAVGVFGSAVVALLTVQSTDGLVASHPIAAPRVIAQAKEVVRAQRVRVIKLGALGSLANVRAVAAWLGQVDLPVVLDPVMLPTRGGSRLLAARALRCLRDELLPRAALVTANALEAAALTGKRVGTVAEARDAAQSLVDLGARAALVKGGHLPHDGEMVDVLALRGESLVELRGPRQALRPLHGGGCVLASLVAAHLAKGEELERAVRSARERHQQALADAVDVGGALRVLLP